MKKLNFSNAVFGILAGTLASLVAIPTSSYGSDIEWNGFGSVYYGQTMNSSFLNYGFRGDQVDFTDFSLMGLNVAGKINDDLTFAGQIIAQGITTTATNSFNLQAQWAFLSYRPNDSTQIKVGRQLYPISLASEYISVGYLLPYQALPTLVRALIPFNAFDGISVGHLVDTPIGKLKLEAFGGSPVFTPLPSATIGSYILANLFGASATVDGDGYQLHLTLSEEFSEGSGGNGPSAYNYASHQDHFSLGYKLEKHNIVSWSEFEILHSPDAVTIPAQPHGPYGPGPGGKLLGFGQAGYSLLGYRIGKFLPRYTYSEGRFLAGIFYGAETIHTFGLNYQFRPQVVMKAEFNLDTVTDGRSFTGTQTLVNPSTTASDVLVGLDFIF